MGITNTSNETEVAYDWALDLRTFNWDKDAGAGDVLLKLERGTHPDAPGQWRLKSEKVHRLQRPSEDVLHFTWILTPADDTARATVARLKRELTENERAALQVDFDGLGKKALAQIDWERTRADAAEQRAANAERAEQTARAQLGEERAHSGRILERIERVLEFLTECPMTDSDRYCISLLVGDQG